MILRLTEVTLLEEEILGLSVTKVAALLLPVDVLGDIRAGSAGNDGRLLVFGVRT